jgi:uncharacterized protein YuzE
MKLEYDAETDAVSIRFAEGRIVESEEVSPGVVLDFDGDGRIVGMEVLGASARFAPGALAAAAAE